MFVLCVHGATVGGPKGNIITNQLVYEVHEVRQMCLQSATVCGRTET